MATIRRNPMSAGTNSLNEKYMNFLEYKGLNTNKNYVSIDQETFTEVNNMYVNQENQLSTRPPEQIFVINSEWKVIKVWKINDKTFYHIQARDDATSLDPGTYYLACPTSWNSGGFELYETTQQIYLCWLNFAYCLFETDKITAIVYGQNKIDFYANNDAVYFPLTEIYTGTGVFTIDKPDSTGQLVLQQPNVLTSGHVQRYLFDPAVKVPNTIDLEGKEVTIRIGTNVYKITWAKNNSKAFYTTVGQFITTTGQGQYQVAKLTSNTFVYLYTDIADIDTTHNNGKNYISADGYTWYEFTLPKYEIVNDGVQNEYWHFTPVQIPVLSRQGGYVYYCNYNQGSANEGIEIYRKKIDVANIDAFSSSDWTLFQTCKITDSDLYISINGMNITTKVISQYLLPGMVRSLWAKPQSGNIAVEEVYNGETYSIPIAFGDADDYTFAYGIMFTSRMFTQSDDGELESIACYYSGCVLAVGDSTKGSTKFCTLNTQETKPELSVWNDMLENLDNKIRIIKTGDTGLLVVYLGGTIRLITGDATKYIIFCSNLTEGFNIEGTIAYRSDLYYTPNAVQATGSSKGTISSAVKYKLFGFLPNGLAWNELSHQVEDMVVFDNGYEYATLDALNGTNITVSRYNVILNNLSRQHEESYYVYYYENITANIVTTRSEKPFTCTITTTNDQYTSTTTISPQVKLSKNNMLMSTNFVNGNEIIPLLFASRPLYIDDAGVAIWMDSSNGVIYSNQYTETISVDNLVKGSIDYIMPEHSVDFITTCLSKENVFYQSSKTLIDTAISEGKNLFYIPKNTKNDNIFTDKITQLVNFSQTALGIFLETTAYQLTYDSSNDIYYLGKTKLALGNRDGSDMLLSYDGNNIYITTLKGLSTLNYQDFVQSTEQIYRYLTEAIMDVYQEYATRPIKLCQYKNWLFLYKSTSQRILVYDLRTSSWWVWKLPQIPKQLVCINDNIFTEDLVLVTGRGDIYKFRFDEASVYDNELIPFDWSFTTQKMHFGAPNNYKHIRSVSIVTEQSGRPLRFKLKFTNYRNLNNLSDSDTVEYDIDQLTTMIKRVNFIKTNAFQLQVSNDKTDKYPQAFVTPNIAIKYRITERLR